MLVCEGELRRICGIVQTEEEWRIGNNDELTKLMREEDVVKCIRVQWIKWWGHLNRMETNRTVRKITEWNPTGKRSKGHPKNRWRDEVLNGSKKLQVKKWT